MTAGYGVILIALASATALLAGISLLRRYRVIREHAALKGKAGEERASTLMDDAGAYDRLEGFLFEDGNGRMAEVDCLVHTPNALILVEVKNWSGEVIAADEREWLLRYRSGRISRRHSPERQLERTRRLIAAQYPEVEIKGFVLSVGALRFLEGLRPESICAAAELKRRLKPTLNESQHPILAGKVEQAWNEIVESAFDDTAAERAEAYRRKLAQHYADRRGDVWIQISMFLAALAMVGVLLAEQAWLLGRATIAY